MHRFTQSSLSHVMKKEKKKKKVDEMFTKRK